jgi:uncharacterized protein (TIRG00374 family)
MLARAQVNVVNTGARFSRRSRWTRIVSFLLGGALLAWLIVSNGAASIVADLGRVGPGVLIILAIEFGAHALNTLGWWFTLPTGERAGTYAWLFWVRSAGQAINESTPAASLGGEPAKIILLRSKVSTGAATASLLASKVTFCLGKTLFIMVGMAVVWSRLELPRTMSLALLVAFIVMVIAIATFAIVQIRGIGTGTVRLLRRVGFPVGWIASIESTLGDVDSHLTYFYRARIGDLLRAVAAHAGGFVCGVFQMLLLMAWLGLAFDPVAAIGIEAFSALIALLTFVVPGSLGVQEGGKVLIFAALGLPRAAAMAVGITFRVISFVDIAVGLAAFTLLQQQRSPAGRPAKRAGTS